MKKLILASKSPRRLELLRMIGINAEPIAPDVDESKITADSPAQLAEKLAKLKSEAVYKALPQSSSPVLAADTLVEVGGKVLGKPKTVAEAKEMLRMLSGKTHYVHTAISIIYSGTSASAIETASVHFREISESEIEEYVMSGEPMDKAGAYGIQGRAGIFVDRIEGDFFSIVGLPLCRLVTLLRNTMGISLADLK